VTVPDGSTVPVSFAQQVDQARVYQVTVNDVPVADITVSSEGDAAVDDPAQNQADDAGDSDNDESDDSGGLLATQPVTVGIGALILLGVVGALLYVRSGTDAEQAAPVQNPDDDVVTVEGFEEESDGPEGRVPSPDGDADPSDQGDRAAAEPPVDAGEDETSDDDTA
jgi:hypothetical protein